MFVVHEQTWETVGSLIPKARNEYWYFPSLSTGKRNELMEVPMTVNMTKEEKVRARSYVIVDL